MVTPNYSSYMAWIDIYLHMKLYSDLFSSITKLWQGVHPTIKGLVWEFLLGCYDPDSTFDERTELRQCRR